MSETAETPKTWEVREPDPRDDPAWWTVGRFRSEARPAPREDGSGGRRRLWVICGKCGVEKTTDLGHVVKVATPITALTFRCQCGGTGKPLLRWVNPPKPQSPEDKASGKWRIHKPRPGSYDFTTGKRTGGWE